MLYSEEANLAFVHVPKTGGTSFRRFLEKSIPDMQDLRELPRPHHTLQEFFHLSAQRGRDPNGVRVITLARDPYAMVASHYTYWRSNMLSREDAKLPHVIAARESSFPDFVQHWVKQDLYKVALCVDDVLPDNVEFIQLKSLHEDSAFVLNELFDLGLQIDIPHLNRSAETPFADRYDACGREKVRELYRWYFSLEESGRLNPRTRHRSC